MGPADLVIHNAVVHTVNESMPQAQAVAVSGNRIVAVGNDEEVLSLAAPGAQVIDAGGRLVLPGFSDNHVHLASAARFLEFNIMNITTQEEFVTRIRRLVEHLPAGEWILGGFWGAYDNWAPGSSGETRRRAYVPDMNRIQELAATHPVFLRKFDDSEFAANSLAMRQAGIDLDSPQAHSIRFTLDENGRASGLMQGDGVLPLFERVMPQSFSHQRRLQQTRYALEEIRRYGVTNVSDMSDDEQLEIYRELQKTGELTVRVHFRYGLERWQELAERGVSTGSGDAWIRLGALKGHVDGIMGNSTARFFQGYSNDPGNRGRWRRLLVDADGGFAPGQFLQHMLQADRQGLQLSIHAIGDEANSLLLGYLEELEAENGKRDRRFRLVHAQVVAEQDFQRLGSLGVIAEVQPYHLSDDMRWMEERIGSERCRGAYAFRSLKEGGAILSFGSDWPGTAAAEYPINPMLGLYAAVTRKTLNGQPPEGWFPDETVTIQEAIRAYTYNTAYGNFEESDKGSIEVGKLADMVILSRNILQEGPESILDARVLYTIVDGKVVYRQQAGGSAGAGP